MKKKGGYGVVYQEVMRNKLLSPEAKAIYAYLSSIAGSGDSCYPSVETMQKELCMSKNRLMKHMGQLIAFGVVEKVRKRNGNIYGRNVYRITHEIEVTNDLKRIFEAVENEAVENRAVENEATNNNKQNNNYLKNSIDYQLIFGMYNSTCVSLPKLTKLSDKRKQAIKARFNQGYTVEDFKRLFELAEGSSFLKGGNSRNWSANFDWLIADANMAKTLDGNYSDRKKVEGGAADGANNQSWRPATDFYEQYLGTGNSD